MCCVCEGKVCVIVCLAFVMLLLLFLFVFSGYVEYVRKFLEVFVCLYLFFLFIIVRS